MAQTAPPAPPATALAEAKPPKIPVALFASRPALSSASLSPDGKRIAFTSIVDGMMRIVVIDPLTRKGQFIFATDEKHELNWFRWAGSDRLLMSFSMTVRIEGEDQRYTRLLVGDIATGKVNFVGIKAAGLLGDDLLYTDPAGQFVLVGVQRSIYDWPSVWRIPLDGTAPKTAREVQRQREGVWDWYADDSSVVRMGVEDNLGRIKILYRKDGTQPLKIIADMTSKEFNEKWTDVARIVTGSDEGYAVGRTNMGQQALYHYNYATRTYGDAVWQSDQWDIDDFVIDDDNKPVAVFYTDDRDRVQWYDPKMKRIQTRLDKAIPGNEMWVTSRAKDGSRMLVWSGGEADPGAIYLFDAAALKLDFLAELRPGLDPALLAKPKAVSYKARDGVSIRAYLTLPRGRAPKGLPLIIMPHGGPYGVRDRLDYSDEVQLLANRGYAVIQPNYRGSGGYGEGFEGLGDGQIGRTMQDDLDDAMDWLVKEGTVDPKRVCVAGSSYGGYAALWAVIRNPERYRCAASFAGVTDWKRQLRYQNNKESDGTERSKWSRKVRGGTDGKFDLDLVSPAKQAARLTRPVLLVHGDKDTRVPFNQFKGMMEAARVAKVPLESLVIAGEGHGFDKAENEEKWYTALEAFLQRHNPAD